MNRNQIINEITEVMYVAEQIENIYIYNSLDRIRKALENEWLESERYAEEIRSVLGYEQTMEDLNNIKL